MKEEIKKFLNNETYILAYRSNYDSAREANQMLIDYINDLQSQLKAKEEVIKEASNRINKTIDEIDKLRSLNGDFKGCKNLLEILSKGENK